MWRMAAIKIQAAWRGWKVRQVYFKAKNGVVPKDKVLWPKFALERLKQWSDGAVSEMQTRSKCIEALLGDVDDVVMKSRILMERYAQCSD